MNNRKPPVFTPSELKQIVTEAVLSVMNNDVNSPAKGIESKLTKLFQLAPSLKTQISTLDIEDQYGGSMASLVLKDNRGNRIPLMSNTSRQAVEKMVPVVSDLIAQMTGKQPDKSIRGDVEFI